ncbi:hypothetical protein [Ligilactobacillus acidipiscis]|nr:hypothetical protein [Ligilactobacillus acidipiscis]
MTRIVVTRTTSESLLLLKASIVSQNYSPWSGRNEQVVFTGFSPFK